MTDTILTPEMWLLPAPRRRDPSARPTVLAIGGDGIGPEIVAATVTCLKATGAPIDIVQPLHGAPALAEKGTAFPDELREQIGQADAILFGAVDTGPNGHCRPILRHLRFGMDTYANIRPAASVADIPSITGGGKTNLTIVRELSEGIYPGCEGDAAELARRWPELRDAMKRPIPERGKFAVQVVTEEASRRVARYAAALAAHRKQLGAGRGHVTIVSKANVLRQSDGLFGEVCAQEIRAHGGLEYSHVYVDEAARRLVACPETFDVLVTTNLYGDILSDVASEIMGGMPLAPSAGIGDGFAYFESCHGSAPDIAGKNIANPTATILSGSMLLGYLGFAEEARRLLVTTLAAITSGCKTRDLGGEENTTSFAENVCRRLAG